MATKQDVVNSRIENSKRRLNTTLFKAPITTLKIFLIVVRLYTINWMKYIFSHKKLLTLAFALLALFTTIYFAPGEHQSLVQETEAAIILGGWWVLLGVLSSVGLGTGLHTFVLYLGPFIAKVTMAATECNSVNFKKYGSDSFLCPDIITSDHEVTLWNVLRMVQFESLLWGAGTALGELPPYFVARAARLAGERIDELQEIESSGENENFIQQLVHKAKKLMFSTLGNLGFFGIMIFASIPNPLFDLAGITSGHFLIPFTTFFGATLIGKAVIKAHIQTIFVISMFRPAILSYWINIVESILPFTKGSIDDFLLNQRSQFHRNSSASHIPQKGLLALAWDCVLFGMLFYFLVSIINSSVQSYLAEKEEEERSKLNLSVESDSTSKKSN